MKCSNCGREVDNDLIFCPGCGTKVVEYVQSVADDYDDDYTVDADADDAETDYFGRVPVYKNATRGASGGKSGTNIWLVIIAAILSAAVVLCIVVLCMGMLKGADAPTGAEKTENVCGICGDNIDAADEFCDNCTDDFTCGFCGDVKEDTQDGVCEDCIVEYTCRACKEVKDDVREGYCKECIDTMKCKGPDCDTILEKGYYCAECIEQIVPEENRNICAYCNKTIKYEDIFNIDTYRSVYCKTCDTGKYCERCLGYIAADSNDTVCVFCADYFCSQCAEVLEEGEISHTDFNGKHYCDKCNSGNYCEDCDAPVGKNEELCKNCKDM